MAINYIPDDELFSSWQPHLDEQSMDKLLKACEFEEPFPDVFDLPPYQALDKIFPIESNDSIYTGDDKGVKTGTSKTQTEEEVDIERFFSMGEPLFAGRDKQMDTGVDEAHPEEKIIDTLKITPLNEVTLTKGNTIEDNIFNSTLSWDGALEMGIPSSGTGYHCCCNEVADMKR